MDRISAYCDVSITIDKRCTLNLEYDQSSEKNWDYFIVFVDAAIKFNGQDKTIGTSGVTIDAGTHQLTLCYRKDSSGTEGRDNAILTFSVSELLGCTEYSKYIIERKKYSTDGGSTWIDTDNYKYGRQIAYQSEECGYIPIIEQWKLVCDDSITYDTTDTGDTHTFYTKNGKAVEVNCVILSNINKVKLKTINQENKNKINKP